MQKENTSFLESENIYLLKSCETSLQKKSASEYYTIEVRQQIKQGLFEKDMMGQHIVKNVHVTRKAGVVTVLRSILEIIFYTEL